MKLSDLVKEIEQFCSSRAIQLYDFELRKDKIIITVDSTDGSLNLDELAGITRSLTDLIDQNSEGSIGDFESDGKESSSTENNREISGSNPKQSMPDRLVESEGKDPGTKAFLVNTSSGIDRDATISLEDFTLEVTTPGVERPLKRPEHFAGVVGKKIAIKFKHNVFYIRRLWAVLERIDGNTLFLGKITETEEQVSPGQSKKSKHTSSKNQAVRGSEKMKKETTTLSSVEKRFVRLPFVSDEREVISSWDNVTITVDIGNIETAHLYFDWRAALSESKLGPATGAVEEEISDTSDFDEDFFVEDSFRHDDLDVSDDDGQMTGLGNLDNMKYVENRDASARRAGNE